MSNVVQLDGWMIEAIEDGRLWIARDGSPGYMTLVAGDEGFIFDVWPDEGNESVATTNAFYTELEPE